MKLYHFVLTLIMILTGISAWADIAIVDFADQWNNQACVGLLLDDLKRGYDDITAEVEKAKFSLDGYKIFIIGSFVTNNETLHNSLDANAGEIEKFLSNGGVVIELTQADQNQANIDWLPKPLSAVRTDTDYAQIVILEKNNPIFNTPNALTEAELSNWGISSGTWSTAWETFGTQSGFTILAARDASGRNPCVLEASYKEGKILLLSIALDKKHVLGTTPASKEKSMLMMENILTAYATAVEANGKLTTTWGNVKSSY